MFFSTSLSFEEILLQKVYNQVYNFNIFHLIKRLTILIIIYEHCSRRDQFSLLLPPGYAAEIRFELISRQEAL